MRRNVTFQLELEDIEKLKKLAEKDHRSIASYLRDLVLKLIEHDDKDDKTSTKITR